MGPVRRLLLLGAVLCGCDSLTTQPVPPSGLVCDRILVASAKLSDTLSSARAGDCVVAAEGTYAGSFVLPQDVSLAAGEGAAVVLQGDGSAGPVLRVVGGPRSSVRNVRIASSGGTGIAIEPGPAALVGVTIGGAAKDALSATCTGADCGERPVTVEDCDLSASRTGLVASGAVVQMTRGRVADMSGPGLADGTGVVATGGAQLTLQGVTVEGNQNIGVLVDGAGTRATLEDCALRANQWSGLWVQGVVDGGVTVRGGDVSQNRLVGIGVLQSQGVSVTGATVQDTQAVKVAVDISRFEDVGDGVGLFQGTRDVVLDTVTLRNNARAQLLVDQCGDAVRVTSPTLAGGLFRAVVQRTGASVDVPPQVVDVPGRVLTVVDQPVPVGR